MLMKCFYFTSVIQQDCLKKGGCKSHYVHGETLFCDLNGSIIFSTYRMAYICYNAVSFLSDLCFYLLTIALRRAFLLLRPTDLLYCTAPKQCCISAIRWTVATVKAGYAGNRNPPISLHANDAVIPSQEVGHEFKTAPLL